MHIRNKIYSMGLALLFCLGVVTAQAQYLGEARTFQYAEDYAQWSIFSQSPNTYTFPSQVCTQAKGGGGQFFPFNVNAPIWILDSNNANSEVVTPSTIVNTAAQCGINVSPLNTHNSFRLTSGTAGLQESLNALSGGVKLYPSLIYLDANWYQLAGSIPGTTPAAIIAAAKGSTSAYLLDISQPQWVFYVWNGTQYVGGASGGAKPTSVTALAAPATTTTATPGAGYLTTATTGGTLPATSTYRIAVTYVDALGGETTISTDTASTSTVTTGATATNTITVTSPAAFAGAVGYRLYVSAAAGAAGSEILYSPTAANCTVSKLESVLPACAIGATSTIKAIVTGTAAVPLQSTAHVTAPSSSFGPSTPFQNVFAPFTSLGAVVAGNTGALAPVNLPAGFLNTLGKTIRLCGQGVAATNGTPGTLSLGLNLYSTIYTTGPTIFTTTSGTTTASATVPFDFCVTSTTAATGATGTLEVHGWVSFGLAGTNAATQAIDVTAAPSATVDLTKQDQLLLTIVPNTTALTAATLRQLTVEVLN